MDATLPLESAPAPRYTARAVLRISVVLSAIAIVWFVWLMSGEVDAADFAKVDLTRTKLLTGATWADPRWEVEIQARLAPLHQIAAEDSNAIERVQRELAALSFVREVSEPEVIWPDGLQIKLRLRTPVACIRIGDQYQPVAEDGTLLSGRWSAPPERGSGYLPVIEVDAKNLEHLHPGPVIWPDDARDALSVAISMWQNLKPNDLAHLGRIEIDAGDARRASVEVPGVEFQLEGGRRVMFGRAANTDEPGELPVANKWTNLSKALGFLEPATPGGDAQFDWELVDLRWDVPELLPRGGFIKSNSKSSVHPKSSNPVPAKKG